jgi:hypothetical protein
MRHLGLALGVGGLAALIAWLGGNLLIPWTIAQLMTDAPRDVNQT